MREKSAAQTSDRRAQPNRYPDWGFEPIALRLPQRRSGQWPLGVCSPVQWPTVPDSHGFPGDWLCLGGCRCILVFKERPCGRLALREFQVKSPGRFSARVAAGRLFFALLPVVAWAQAPPATPAPRRREGLPWTSYPNHSEWRATKGHSQTFTALNVSIFVASSQRWATSCHQLPRGVTFAPSSTAIRVSGPRRGGRAGLPLARRRSPHEFASSDGTLWASEQPLARTLALSMADIDAVGSLGHPQFRQQHRRRPSSITGVNYTHKTSPPTCGRILVKFLPMASDDDGNGSSTTSTASTAATTNDRPGQDCRRMLSARGAFGRHSRSGWQHMGLGVCGVAWRVQIMACKFIRCHRHWSTSDLMEWPRVRLTGNGAKVINCSFVVPGPIRYPCLTPSGRA